MPTLAEEFLQHRAAQPERDVAAAEAAKEFESFTIAGWFYPDAIAASALRHSGKGEDAKRERKLPADFDVHVYLAERLQLAEADRQKLIERDRAARQAAIDDAKGRLF